MELNRRKYNWIVISLIVLISAVVIFSAVELTQIKETVPADSVAESTTDAESNGSLEGEVQIPDNKNYLPSAPSFSSGWKALNYAYNIKANYSYSSNFSQTNVNDPILGIVVRQSMSHTRYKTDNETLILATAHCDNSEGVNFSSYTYTNEAKNKVETRVCYNSDWNFTNEQVKTYTISDFKAERGQTLNEPYFQLSSKNATLDSFKIAGANYVLKLTLKSNVEGVFDDMIKSIENGEAPGIKDAKGISATFEITINRKTGAFVEIKSTERYSVCKLTNSFGWQNSTITANNTETFNFADIKIDKLVASTIA